VTTPQVHKGLLSTYPWHRSGKPKESLRKSLARCHLLCSFLILVSMATTSGRALLKTTSLQCLQIHHKIRMMAVQRSCWVVLGQGGKVHHRSSPTSAAGSQASLSYRWRAHAQISRATTHPRRRWWIVSSSWLQSGQAGRHGRPRRSSRSAVQHLFLETIQAKNLPP
jgi:hypothetical protein